MDLDTVLNRKQRSRHDIVEFQPSGESLLSFLHVKVPKLASLSSLRKVEAQIQTPVSPHLVTVNDFLTRRSFPQDPRLHLAERTHALNLVAQELKDRRPSDTTSLRVLAKDILEHPNLYVRSPHIYAVADIERSESLGFHLLLELVGADLLLLQLLRPRFLYPPSEILWTCPECLPQLLSSRLKTAGRSAFISRIASSGPRTGGTKGTGSSAGG